MLRLAVVKEEVSKASEDQVSFCEQTLGDLVPVACNAHVIRRNGVVSRFCLYLVVHKYY